MNTTPSDKMFTAMVKMVDVMIGEAPNTMDVSKGAQERRQKRLMCMDVLHHLVTLAMREGVNRAVLEARQRLAGPRDAEDRSAIDQAKDDAVAGKSRIVLPN